MRTHHAIRFLLGALAAISAVGCGNPESIDLTPQSVLTSQKNSVLPPYFGVDTSLGLLNGDDVLHAGDPATNALDFFGRPKRAYEFRDLPEQFGGNYRARGWETDSEGFGLILYGDRIAIAIRQYMSVDRDFVQEIVDRYTRMFGREFQHFSGRSARYWFWQREQHRLMICATATGRSFHLSIAVGELNAMNGLWMSPDAAAQHIKRADRSLAGENPARK